jgi:hypothetical protein
MTGRGVAPESLAVTLDQPSAGCYPPAATSHDPVQRQFAGTASEALPTCQVLAIMRA